jgi:hypothetical protein
MADVFTNLLPFLTKTYAFYCSWYTVAMDTLRRLRMTNPALNAHVVLQEKHRVDEDGGMLAMLLVKPVHRIARYVQLWELTRTAVDACKPLAARSSGHGADTQKVCMYVCMYVCITLTDIQLGLDSEMYTYICVCLTSMRQA